MKNLIFFLSTILTTVFSFAQYAVPTEPISTLQYVPEVMPGEVLVHFNPEMEIAFDAQGNSNIPVIQSILDQYSIKEVVDLFPYIKPLPRGETSFTTYTGQTIEYPDLRSTFKIVLNTDSGHVALMEDLQSLGKTYVDYAELNFILEIQVSHFDTIDDPMLGQQWGLEATQADTVQALLAADSTKSDTGMVIAIIDTGVDKDHEDLENKMWVNLLELNGIAGVDDDQNGYIDDIDGWDFINNDNSPMDDNSHGTHVAGIAAAEVNNGKGIAGVSAGAKIMAIKALQSSGRGSAGDIASAVLYAANKGADVINMSLGGYGRSFTMENALAYAYAFSYLVAAAGNDGIWIDPMCGIPAAPHFPGAFTFVLGVENSNSNGNRFGNKDCDPFISSYPDELNYELRAPGTAILSSIPRKNGISRYRVLNGSSMASPSVAAALVLYKCFRPNSSKERTFIDFIRSQSPYGGGGSYGAVKILDAIHYVGSPYLQLISWAIEDSTNADADGRADAGETIELTAKIKNIGLSADTVWGILRPGEYEDTSLFTIIDSVISFGSVNEYGIIENNLPQYGLVPFKIQLDSNIVNDRDLVFELELHDSSNTYLHEIVITIQNGVEFNNSQYPGTVHFTAGKYYLISGNPVFDTLIIHKGAIIHFELNSTIYSNYLEALGTPDSIITFSSADGNNWTGFYKVSNESYSRFSYCRFSKMGQFPLNWPPPRAFNLDPEIIENCIFDDCILYRTNFESHSLSYETFSLQYNDTSGQNIFSTNMDSLVLRHKTAVLFTRNVIKNSIILSGSNLGGIRTQDAEKLITPANEIQSDTIQTFMMNGYVHYQVNATMRNNGPYVGWFGRNIFIGNKYYTNTNSPYAKFPVLNTGSWEFQSGAIFNNFYSLANGSSTMETNVSLGTTQSNTLNVIDAVNLKIGGLTSAYKNEALFEVFDFPGYGLINLLDTIDATGTHGYVTGCKLNGISIHFIDNPYNSSSGIGLAPYGTFVLEVQFNRAMDTSFTPLVTYGVRIPYTQHIISDSAFWSADSTSWTAYFTIDELTQSDGENRIRVAMARDDEGFEIPIEDRRFRFRIATLQAMSEGLIAYGDTGRIKVEWEYPIDQEEVLGFNIYRLDSNLQPAQVLNNVLLTDTQYVDPNVQGGVWYGYFIETLLTDLDSLGFTDTAWATPLTGPPSVITDEPQNIGPHAASMQGRLVPHYLQTKARFNYGTTTALGNLTTWVQKGNWNDTLSHQLSLTGLSPGQQYFYRLEAENADGISYGEIRSFYTLDFPNVQIQLDTVICQGDSLHIQNMTSISNGSLSYQWNFGNGQYSTSKDPAVYYTSPGFYTINLSITSDQAVNTYWSQVVEVRSNPQPSVSTSGPLSFCQGDQVSLSLTQAYAGYQWSNGANGQSINVSTSGLYHVQVTDNYGCVATSSDFNVEVHPLPSPQIISNDALQFCTGGSADLASNINGSSYQWSSNGTDIPGANGQQLTVQSSGLYQVSLIDSNGCAGLSNVESVTVNTLPTATITPSVGGDLCQGDTMTLTGSGGAQYSWSNGSGQASIQVYQPGTYSLEVTDTNACASDPVTYQVQVNVAPSMSITPLGNTTFCAGGSVSLLASGGFSSYSWNNGIISNLQTVNQSGTYTVAGTTSDGCIATGDTIEVHVLDLPSAQIGVNGNLNLCQGDSVYLYADATAQSWLWNTGDSAQGIWIKTSGIYNCQILSQNGCSVLSDPVSVVVGAAGSLSVNPQGSTTFCEGGSVQLQATAGMSSYTWNTGANGLAILVDQSGSYWLSGLTSGGCLVQSDTIEVVVNPNPTGNITYSGNGTICDGDSLELNGPTSGNLSYLWNTGESSTSIYVSTPGIYQLQLTNTHGCSSFTPDVTVQVTTVPVPQIISSGPLVFCQGDQVTLQATGNYTSMLWNTGSTYSSLVVNQSGNYWVQAFVGNCSSTSSPVNVVVHSNPNPTITANGPTNFCPGDSVELEAAGAYTSYQWNNGSDQASIFATDEGDYAVQVTDQNNCEGSSNVITVNWDPAPVKPQIYYAAQTNQLISSSVQGNQWYFNGSILTGADQSVYSPIQNGAYSVIVTNSYGCVSEESDPFNYINVSISEEYADGIRLYPNPNSGKFTLEGNNLDGALITVFDKLGRELINIEGTSEKVELQMESVQAGTYHVLIETGDSRSVRSVVVIE